MYLPYLLDAVLRFSWWLCPVPWQPPHNGHLTVITAAPAGHSSNFHPRPQARPQIHSLWSFGSSKVWTRCLLWHWWVIITIIIVFITTAHVMFPALGESRNPQQHLSWNICITPSIFMGVRGHIFLNGELQRIFSTPPKKPINLQKTRKSNAVSKLCLMKDCETWKLPRILWIASVII